MLPTRITEKTATLIDNIFVNGQAQKYNSGNITTSISDHLSQLIIIEIEIEINQLKQHIETIKIFTWTPLKQTYIQGIDWIFATHNDNVNLGFEAFLQLFNTTLDKNAPIKEFTKIEEKDKLKPWVTKGIKNVCPKQNLQTNDKGKRSADKNRKKNYTISK